MFGRGVGLGGWGGGGGGDALQPKGGGGGVWGKSIATGLGREPVGGCYSAEMRRPAIRSTAHDPILSYPTYQPPIQDVSLQISVPNCVPLRGYTNKEGPFPIWNLVTFEPLPFGRFHWAPVTYITPSCLVLCQLCYFTFLEWNLCQVSTIYYLQHSLLRNYFVEPVNAMPQNWYFSIYKCHATKLIFFKISNKIISNKCSNYLIWDTFSY